MASIRKGPFPAIHCFVIELGISFHRWDRDYVVEARRLPRKIRQLKADLRRAGFHEDRIRGSHSIWKHPSIPGISANLAGNDGDDAKRYQEEEVRLAIRAAREAAEKERK